MLNHDSTSEPVFSVQETLPNKDVPVLRQMAGRRTQVLDASVGAVMRLGDVVEAGWVQQNAPRWYNPAIAQPQPGAEAPVAESVATETQGQNLAYPAPSAEQALYAQPTDDGYDRQTHAADARAALNDIWSQN